MRIFTTINREKFFLTALFLITFLPRFLGLGFSEFYGDETKTLYWNKTVPAAHFLLDQRKGPVQFVAVWVMEKLTGGFNEFAVRVSFALAGVLSVFVLYIVVKKWFGVRVAATAAFFFSINGLFIAFSRTAQYQSFLWLFGFLAIWFAQNRKYVWAGVFLGLGLLSHYDAIFFAIPVVLELVQAGILKNRKNLLMFAAPVAILAGAFYLPYFLRGYFEANTIGYVSRRVGISTPLLQTFHTYNLYNPFVLSIPLALLGLAGLRKSPILTVWFAIPFVVFEVFFSDPGTHIQQYLIPLIILSAIVINDLVAYSAKFKVLELVLSMFVIIGVAQFYYNFANFIPAFDKNYPWRNSELVELNKEIYIYGFPYNRGWKSVADHLRKNGAKDFYTNDNITVAEYYLLGIPSNKYEPQFYVDVSRNRMFRPLEQGVFGRFEYILDAEIEVAGRETAKIYRRLWML